MKEGDRRDELALERTHLANERTLLAYARTALAFAAAGALLLQFFPGYMALFGIAWGLIAAGVAVIVIGARRFFIVARRVRGNSKQQ